MGFSWTDIKTGDVASPSPINQIGQYLAAMGSTIPVGGISAVQSITLTHSGVSNTALWVLVNAEYHASDGYFYRKDASETAFGLQIQGSGAIYGEEQIDASNQGFILWKCSPRADGTAKIGADVSGTWTTFGVQYGWYLGFVFDSYGHLVLGGQGIEIDGAGTTPYARLVSSPSNDTNLSRKIYQGLLTNLYADLSGRDSTTAESWFAGVMSDVGDGNTAENGVFAVRYLASGAALGDSTLQTLLTLTSAGVLTVGGSELAAKPVVLTADNASAAAAVSVSYPSGYTKENACVLAVKGTESDGSVQQFFPLITLTDYGLYIGGTGGYIAVSVVLTKT